MPHPRQGLIQDLNWGWLMSLYDTRNGKQLILHLHVGV